MKRYLVETPSGAVIVEADNYKLEYKEGTRYTHFVFYKGEKKVGTFEAKYAKAITILK